MFGCFVEKNNINMLWANFLVYKIFEVIESIFLFVFCL